MVRISRRQGFWLMFGASQAVLLGTGSAAAKTYDEQVFSLGTAVTSYWKFQNSGTDGASGQHHATFTGTPELNVDTVVHQDTVAEGAPADGRCIAWPGTAGVYAQAAHNAAHKTAQGTIVVTFQRDTANQQSTLVAADANSVTVGVPGGLSVEVTATGQPRAFLRRQSDGLAVIMVGEAGDVQLNKAYTLIFKWGPSEVIWELGGLSLALWDDRGLLVRRLTNALADGVTGTSPIRFGLWHDGVQSPHDGPYGRVLWLNSTAPELRGTQPRPGADDQPHDR